MERPSAKRLTDKKTFLNDGKRIPLSEQGHWTRDSKEQGAVEVAGMKDKRMLRNKRHQNKKILSSPHRFISLTALVIDIQAKFKYNRS